tara:strand:+ start:2684 stop:4510 length:1827 start_codon:yes stop_codon:yes gene_type:complete
MCGIVGKINFNNTKVNNADIQNMMDSIKHRGPNDEGFFIDKHIGFGFVRLSVIDLSDAGHQPMFDLTQRYMIIYNGEIYNYIEIKDELINKGYKFNSQTDTEVILYAYIEWGEECIQKFNGMWSFAIYDKESKSIFISRDRYGIKPFYYYLDNNILIFGSEIPALLRVLNQKPRANYTAIYNYLIFNRTDYNSETFFDGIKKLKHGCNMHVINNKVTIKPWYNLEQSLKEPFKDPESYLEMFNSSISLRLRSDVPLGVCLSGGLDSSSIASCLLKKFNKTNLYTFSAIYGKDKNGDESEYISLFNQDIKNMNFVKPDYKSFFNDLDSFIDAHSEPVPSISPYAQFKVMELASKNVVVTLDGQGADEQLAGYHYFFGYLFKELLMEAKIKTFLSENYYYLKNNKSFFAQKSLVYFLLPNKIKNSSKSSQGMMLNKDFIMDNYKNSDLADSLYSSHNLRKSLLDHFEYKLEHLLKWDDRNSMRFSVESRVPFLDYRIVEKTLSLQTNQIIKNGINKYILRQAMKGIVPEQILNRHDKVGFETPQDSWLRKDIFKNMILDIINSDSFLNRNIFSIHKANKYLNLYFNGKINSSKQIWKMINLELWFRKYLD